MAYISFQPKDYFNTKLYAGNNTADTSITGVGFSPSWVWLKNRDNGVGSHGLFDAVRGVSQRLKSDDGAAETTASGVSSFDSDGFTLGTSWNQASTNFVSWNWLANGQGSSNTNGTINSTYTSASSTSGFSIVTYTGTGSAGTVGHGLSTAPTTVWIKQRNGTEQFYTYWKAIGAGNQMTLAGTDASAEGGVLFNSTDATNTVFSVGTHGSTNASGSTYVAYCFAPIKGFSSIGTFTASNPCFVYTGFKPAFVILKRYSATGNWSILDNKRANSFNPQDPLYANTTDAEQTSDDYDLVSNGFVIRNASGGGGGDSGSMLYMAIADEPLVSSNGIPNTAR